MDDWKTSFLLGKPIFRCYVSFREGTSFSKDSNLRPMASATFWIFSFRKNVKNSCVSKWCARHQKFKSRFFPSNQTPFGKTWRVLGFSSSIPLWKKALDVLLNMMYRRCDVANPDIWHPATSPEPPLSVSLSVIQKLGVCFAWMNWNGILIGHMLSPVALLSSFEGQKTKSNVTNES